MPTILKAFPPVGALTAQKKSDDILNSLIMFFYLEEIDSNSRSEIASTLGEVQKLSKDSVNFC